MYNFACYNQEYLNFKYSYSKNSLVMYPELFKINKFIICKKIWNYFYRNLSKIEKITWVLKSYTFIYQSFCK